jgi:hypothetical protein
MIEGVYMKKIIVVMLLLPSLAYAEKDLLPKIEEPCDHVGVTRMGAVEVIGLSLRDPRYSATDAMMLQYATTVPIRYYYGLMYYLNCTWGHLPWHMQTFVTLHNAPAENAKKVAKLRRVAPAIIAAIKVELRARKEYKEKRIVAWGESCLRLHKMMRCAKTVESSSAWVIAVESVIGACDTMADLSATKQELRTVKKYAKRHGVVDLYEVRELSQRIRYGEESIVTLKADIRKFKCRVRINDRMCTKIANEIASVPRVKY